jgi:hypothetical protein
MQRFKMQDRNKEEDPRYKNQIKKNKEYQEPNKGE